MLPAAAEAELEHTALLVVLSHFAGPGRYDPTEPFANDPANLRLLVVDPDTPQLRSFAWAWWTNGRAQGRFISTGTTLTPEQTVVANIWFEPA